MSAPSSDVPLSQHIPRDITRRHRNHGRAFVCLASIGCPADLDRGHGNVGTRGDFDLDGQSGLRVVRRDAAVVSQPLTLCAKRLDALCIRGERAGDDIDREPGEDVGVLAGQGR